MNYINFKMILSRGITIDEFITLQSIFQKDFVAVQEENMPNLIQKGYIIVNKKPKVTKKGRTLLIDASKPSYDDSIGELSVKLKDIYESYNKETGTILEVRDRLTWFVGSTGFTDNVIINEVTEYVSLNPEYTKKLENLIWSPRSKAFSVHYSLKDSKLYDLICKRYGLNEQFYSEPRDKATEWMFDVSKMLSKLPKRGDGLWFTGSPEGDATHIKKIRNQLSEKIKRK